MPFPRPLGPFTVVPRLMAVAAVTLEARAAHPLGPTAELYTVGQSNIINIQIANLGQH